MGVLPRPFSYSLGFFVPPPNQPAQWVVVTGATHGIGRGIAKRCLDDGYSVLAIGRRKDALAELRLLSDERIETLALDLRQSDAAERIFDALIAQKIHAILSTSDPGDTRDESSAPQATLHGIVHCAGVSVGDDIERITDEDWQSAHDINVTAPMRITRALLPMLYAAHTPSIIHIGSPVGIVGARKVSYAASKAAMHGLNAALARNLGSRGIRVNAVLPGPTIPGMISDWSEDKIQRVVETIPLGRLCTPEDVAGVTSFLLSDDASFITGSILNVTGGKDMGI